MQLAAEAAWRAGELIRNGYTQLQKIESKGVGDLVSEIDRQADEQATQVLQQDQAQRPILSEELSPELSGNADDLWIVDPLDGTSSFLFKTGPSYSSVLIALRKNGITELGVVYFPVTQEWFYAEQGKGAFRGETRIESSQTCTLSEGWVELNHYGDSSFETDTFQTLRTNLRSSAGAKLVTQNAAYSGVAARIADPDTMLVAAVHDNNPSSVKQAAWDIAAPQCILEEAGGVFSTINGGNVDPFVAEPFIVAANQNVADSILCLLE